MRAITVVLMLVFAGTAFAQGNAQPTLKYSFAELRYVDVDNSGDGFRLAGSYNLQQNWLIVGGLTRLNFGNDVDSTMFEIGAGYVWPWLPDWV